MYSCMQDLAVELYYALAETIPGSPKEEGGELKIECIRCAPIRYQLTV
jgi:hypothetical protein